MPWSGTERAEKGEPKINRLFVFQKILMQPKLHLTKDCKEICWTVSQACQREGGGILHPNENQRF